MSSLDLLSSGTRVEAPFIKVAIGDYVFGSYEKVGSRIRYPKYMKELRVTKLNGAVNNYTLVINYPITENDDPNFFAKVFASVADSRRIVFSYGDSSVPSFCYRDEEATITKVKTKFNIPSSTVTYTVSAISNGALASMGVASFPERVAQPSEVIREVLYRRSDLGLLDVFYGMKDEQLVTMSNLLCLGQDKTVTIQAKTMSALDYILYLVGLMSPVNNFDGLSKKGFFSLTVIDDTSGKFGGPYFKITRSDKAQDMQVPYEVNIGYHTKDIVTEFETEDDESYQLLYKFTSEVRGSEYVQRIDDDGNFVQEFAPAISSNTPTRTTTPSEQEWWSKVTQFPIKARITIKGLLRPAILMTYVKVNILMYGRKYVDSGLYVVTKQQDTVNENGFRTTLSLLRVGGQDGEDMSV